MTWRTLFSLANLLSLTRFPLAAAFALAETTPVRVAILGMASATDLLDGWIARRFGHTSRWGALLDPVADKTFVLVALVSFVLRGDLTIRDLGTILVRDFATLLGAVVAWLMPGLDVKRFKARLPGKVVTVLQLVTLLVLCVAQDWTRPMVFAVALASIVAIADYTLVLARALPRRP
ncbi:MAG: CDP-alcohol phosphatidyltransferase family protein [Gemmatimonadota bacterium]|nr:CDP-alcohol phosphatidyltransferase family protein [Gemmatimonadota bacterium]